MPKIQHAPTGV